MGGISCIFIGSSRGLVSFNYRQPPSSAHARSAMEIEDHTPSNCYSCGKIGRVANKALGSPVS